VIDLLVVVVPVPVIAIAAAVVVAVAFACLLGTIASDLPADHLDIAARLPL
jgi:hypothetical protein